MGMENGVSLADIAAVTKENEGIFGNGGMWIFALLILLLIGNGGFGTGSTFGQADALMNSQFNDLERQVSEIANRQFTQANELTKGICSAEYTNAQLANATQSMISDNANTLRFDLANYASAIQANDTANTQKILDVLCQNKTEALMQRVNQLELKEAVSGVPRVNPYGYYMAPINYCNCNNGNI